MTLMNSKVYSFIFAIIILAAYIIPFTALAAESEPTTGTVVINVTDEYGDDVSGNWLLHFGTRTIRNGMRSYSFETDPHSYTLEARAANNYPYRVITTENPQMLEAGETITFDVMYFKTEEDMIAAEARDYAILGKTEKEVAAEEVVVEEEEEEEAPAPAVTTPTKPSLPVVYAPTFETAPQPYVPEFTEAPAGNEEAPVEESNIMAVPALAATGPGLLALLAASAMGGIIAGKKKRK